MQPSLPLVKINLPVVIHLVWLCLLLTACVPDQGKYQLETTSDLGLDTLRRIDALNRTLAQGAEIGPNTRAMVDDLNQTIQAALQKGIKLEANANAGLSDPTLARIDALLRVLEQDLGVTVAVQATLAINAGLDEKTLAAVKDLTNTINDAPERWEATATEIIRTLQDSATTAGAQMADEVERLLTNARIDAQRVTAAVGEELRCNIDFAGAKAGATIDEFIGRSLIGRFQAIFAQQAAEPVSPTPWVCQITPNQITLIQSGEQLVVERALLTVTGYNFSENNLPLAYVQDESGQQVADMQLTPFRTSAYQLQLNLQEIDFGRVPARSILVFQWPNPTDRSAIAILLPERPTPTLTPTPQAELVINDQQINIRSGPGTEYEIVGLAEPGARFPVLGSNGDQSWWQIQMATGVGWVYAPLVTRNEITVPVANDIALPPPTPLPPATDTPLPSATPVPPTATAVPLPPTATPVPPTATFTPEPPTPIPPPTPVVRHLLLNGRVTIRDDETFGDDEWAEATVGERFLLTPPEISLSYSAQWCAGDEVRGELHLQLDLQADGVVHVYGRALYFEGTDCDTSDLEKSENLDLWVPVDQAIPLTSALGDQDGDVKLELTLTNAHE